MHAATLVQRTANQALRLGNLPGSYDTRQLGVCAQTRKRQAVRTVNDKWGTESFFISKPECARPITVTVTVAVANCNRHDDGLGWFPQVC